MLVMTVVLGRLISGDAELLLHIPPPPNASRMQRLGRDQRAVQSILHVGSQAQMWAGTADGLIRVYQSVTGRLLRVWSAHSSGVTALAIGKTAPAAPPSAVDPLAGTGGFGSSFDFDPFTEAAAPSPSEESEPEPESEDGGSGVEVVSSGSSVGNVRTWNAELALQELEASADETSASDGGLGGKLSKLQVPPPQCPTGRARPMLSGRLRLAIALPLLRSQAVTQKMRFSFDFVPAELLPDSILIFEHVLVMGFLEEVRTDDKQSRPDRPPPNTHIQLR